MPARGRAHGGGGRGADRVPGPVCERPDRLLRHPRPRAGLDLPLPRRGVHPRWPGRRRRRLLRGLAAAPDLPPREPTAAEIRAWAVEQGFAVSAAGRVPARILAAYRDAPGSVDRRSWIGATRWHRSTTARLARGCRVR
ncbi:Lsr2 family protein [Nocardioides deserti]|uniref:Lsr2 family protein n=1 Tax=Nocardioides deserti TaxID=1588644 RepID=A0ABR6U762_9ACTN|nr:Lsr2 family protein [Nocardioides deserti]